MEKRELLNILLGLSVILNFVFIYTIMTTECDNCPVKEAQISFLRKEMAKVAAEANHEQCFRLED